MTAETTSPKPFVFVLMPFDSGFDDIYAFGIKGAATDVGAYAERVDEQHYSEGILERIFNQINKADVIVADMTGRNANVFYEVGYAHALNKVVLLLTQHADDIPFDLKHRQHIIYAGRIDDLRRELRDRLAWAIQESRRKEIGSDADLRFSLYLNGTAIALHEPNGSPARVTVRGVLSENGRAIDLPMRLAVRNDSPFETENITHVYMLGSPHAGLYPFSSLDSGGFGVALRTPFPAATRDSQDGLSDQYRLRGYISAMPPGGAETTLITFRTFDLTVPQSAVFRLRFHTRARKYDFGFDVHVDGLQDV